MLIRTVPLTAQDGFAFSVAFGYTGVSGDWGQIFKNGVDADVNIKYLLQSGIRLGAGAYYVSYNLEPPLEGENVSNVQLQALAGYMFSMGRVRPYVQGRGVWLRLRPEGETFNPTPPDEEGENTAPQRSGTGAVVVVGVEVVLIPHLTLDASTWFGAFQTSDLDLSDFGGPIISDGRSWGLRLGVNWYPRPEL